MESTTEDGHGWAEVEQASTLPPNGCQSRFGVAYFRHLCAQVGVGFDETSTDEDVLAIDGSLAFSTPIRVQIKCSSSMKLSGSKSHLHVTPRWRDLWKDSGVPVYVVIVLVPKSRREWLLHHDRETTVRATAFWQRVDTGLPPGGVKIPTMNRLTAASIAQWQKDTRGIGYGASQAENVA